MRSDAELLRDIKDNIQLAQSFVEGVTVDDFVDRTEKFYAVTRCLEIISEASKRLSAHLKQKYPELRWSEIAGAGNVYRHNYERVSAEVIWGTVQNALPALLAVVQSELGGA